MVESRERATIEASGPNELKVGGPLIFSTVTRLRKEGLAVFGEGTEITLNLGAVTHTDSAGLALMFEWLRAARTLKSRLYFVNVPQQMVAIASTTKVEHLLFNE